MTIHTEPPAGNPFPFEPANSRVVLLGEKMRETFFRDGCVTDAVLITEGFTEAEIAELGDEAKAYAYGKLTTKIEGGDKLSAIISKAVLACEGIMPVTAGTEITDGTRHAWGNYCTAMAAFKLDPWLSQQERTLARLRVFLGFLPLLATEVNVVTVEIAKVLKRRVNRAIEDNSQ